ncbi:hypothetical protein [Pseudomonas sp. SST3]|uniref:hypothetical protein n=1 Tax=Pseudomonas sp. SST3 TaxID=2267882 RepID=UPI0031392BB2
MSHDQQLNLSTRNARLIIFARGVSDFGAFLNMVALSTYVYWLSQSVVFVSIFLACRVTGGIVASLFGIPFFRRFAGRGTLAGLDLARALLLMPLLVLFTGPSTYPSSLLSPSVSACAIRCLPLASTVSCPLGSRLSSG